MRFEAKFSHSQMTTVKKNTKKGKSSKFLVFAFFIIFSNTALSGAWVPKIDSGYSKLAFSQYSADDFFGGNSALMDFTGKNVSFYGEYGFANNFAVYGTLLYQDVEQVNNAGAETQSRGFGDTELGVRYQWKAEPFVLSSSFLVKLPYFYDTKDALPRGSGKEDYEVRTLIGRSLNAYGYLGFEAAYRLRSGSASDEVRFLFEYGFSINKNAYLRTKLDTIISVKNTEAFDRSQNLSVSSGYNLTKIELTAGWTFNKAKNSHGKWGVEMTYREDLVGDNTLKGSGIELGLTKVF